VSKFISNSFNELFCESISYLQSRGNRVKSRGSEQLEQIFYSCTLTDPRNLDITVPARKFNSNYSVTEWLWYLSKDRNVHNISKFAKIWDMIKDENNEVESNYGTYIFSSSFGNQWEWVKNELASDRDSRRATIAINQPHHKSGNSKDFPCTQYMHFLIRDNRLHLGVCMRSNDAVFGFCNDVFTFCMFQQLMVNELNDIGLNVKLGKYHHTAGSFHVYERHYTMMNNISSQYDTRQNSMGKKFSLKGNVTYQYMKENGLIIPNQDMEKSQIKELVEMCKDKIYVK